MWTRTAMMKDKEDFKKVPSASYYTCSYMCKFVLVGNRSIAAAIARPEWLVRRYPGTGTNGPFRAMLKGCISFVGRNEVRCSRIPRGTSVEAASAAMVEDVSRRAGGGKVAADWATDEAGEKLIPRLPIPARVWSPKI